MSTDFFASASSSSATRWLTEEVFKLIELVQQNEAIYNSRHKYYFCRPYVENFWREVDQKLEKNAGASLAKWTNLRISFRREYTNFLEEKVAPCWSYFDRMFFLHPFLRKKHQLAKQLDQHVQNNLTNLNSLSNRFQHQRETTEGSNLAQATGSQDSKFTDNRHQLQPLDHYLDYFDDTEHNNSEIDEMIDDDVIIRCPIINTHSPREIKSECEDSAEEYDVPHPKEEYDQDQEDSEVNFTSQSIGFPSSSPDKGQKRRAHYMERFSIRSYHEDLRIKRTRSHENITSSQATNSNTQGMLYLNTPTMIRSFITKPMEIVSTTTNHANSTNETELTSSADAITTSSTIMQNAPSGLPRHHRLDILPEKPNTSTITTSAQKNSGSFSVGSHSDLCDCKTDPDAMFLMSLLPDIQKLDGRDRGKIKIAFQNILQDYLYPD